MCFVCLYACVSVKVRGHSGPLESQILVTCHSDAGIELRCSRREASDFTAKTLLPVYTHIMIFIKKIILWIFLEFQTYHM